MRQIIISFFLLLCSVSVFAQSQAQIQTENVKTDLVYHGGKYYQYGNVLSHQQLLDVVGQDAYSKYKVGRGLRTSGIVVTSVGGAFLLTSGILLITSSNEESTGGMFAEGIVGGVTLIIGGATTVAGVALLIAGNSTLRKVAKTYNLNNGRQISLVPARRGIGVALKF